MQAQIIQQFGPPSVFTLCDINKPILKPGHVIIKVCATSVNQIDCKIRSGMVPEIAPDFPAILHGDVAGYVDAVANDIKQFKPGDEIYGCAGGLKGSGGALAEYMLVDARLIAKKPLALSMRRAAALPLTGITAWEALFVKIQLKKHQHILIHGGVGGVGNIAIQLAKWARATVSTTVLKDEDFALAKQSGADNVINARQESVADYVQRLTQKRGFDIVFDTVGGENLERSFLSVAINGNIVTTAARSTHDLTPMHNKALGLHVVFMLLPILNNEGRAAHGKILQQLAKIVDAGKLKPLIDQHVFTLESVSNAHTLVESGKARGKVVITI